MLMIASGLLGRSLLTMQRANTGVDPTNVVSVRLNASPARIESPQSAIQFYDAVLAKAAAIPGVDLVGVASHLPLSGGGETKSFWVEGHAPNRLEDLPNVVGRMESPNTLKVLGVPLLRGRWFTDQDGPDAPYVAIIGESVARRYFANSDPLGQRISLHAPEALSPPTGNRAGLLWPRFTVIGVVKDVQYGDARDAKEDAVYVNYAQGRQVWTWGPQWLVIKTSRPAGLIGDELRDALHTIDASMPVTDVRPLSEQMALSLKAPRFTAGLIATFAIVAALLGIVGLYGVISYTIAQETPAFGVRLALGAQPGDISAMVLRRGLVLAGAGVVVGIAGAIASTRFISAQLFGVQPLDLPSYAVATTVLILLSLLATARPARRAASTDVLVALRAE
jgi:predicted permease